MLCGRINRTPPTRNSFRLQLRKCSYCKDTRVCKVFPSESQIVARVIVCLECEDKQLRCEECHCVIEGFPGQKLGEIRYHLTPNAPVWNKLNHPFEGPVYCDDCSTRLERELYASFYENLYDGITVWPADEDTSPETTEESNTDDEVEIVYEFVANVDDNVEIVDVISDDENQEPSE